MGNIPTQFLPSWRDAVNLPAATAAGAARAARLATRRSGRAARAPRTTYWPPLAPSWPPPFAELLTGEEPESQSSSLRIIILKRVRRSARTGDSYGRAGQDLRSAQHRAEVVRGVAQGGYFHADETAPGPRFSIVIPPPNVTGVLHMGHVLNNTLQDVLVRFKRMDGKSDAVDAGHRPRRHRHAERRREAARQARALDRHDLGREAFVERVWAWKEQYGGTILLPAAAPRLPRATGERERFTMDDGLSQAVREVFVRLYEKGLIYRGQRIIHWCPRCHTALSDEEAVTTEGGETGHLWHIRYPAEDGGDGAGGGDDAPGDDARRHRRRREPGRRALPHLIGKRVDPAADEPADPDRRRRAGRPGVRHRRGEGDAGARRQRLRDGPAPRPAAAGHHGHRRRASTTTAAPTPASTASRRASSIVADLEAQGLLVKTEPYRVPVRRCYRCDTVDRAVPVAAVVREDGSRWRCRRIAAVRERPAAPHPGALDRRLPALDGEHPRLVHQPPAVVGAPHPGLVLRRLRPRDRGAHRSDARARSAAARTLHQDPDVLDTWFSSWLWPFSTGLAGGHADAAPLLSDRHAGHRRRHHLLLGGAHGDGRLRVHGRVPVHATSTSTASSATCRGGRCRSRSATRPTRSTSSTSTAPTRCASPSSRWRRRAGRALRRREDRARPQLRQQDLERGALRADEPRRRAGRCRAADDAAARERWGCRSAGSCRACRRSIDDVRAALAAYRFNDAALDALPVHLARVLRLVPRAESSSRSTAPTRRRSRRRGARWCTCSSRRMRLLHPFMPFVTEEIWQALPIERPTDSRS